MPDWVMANGSPATVSVPVRGADDDAGETAKETVPGPDPLTPVEIVTPERLDTAVQAQPGATETPIWPLPPVAENAALPGEI